MGNVFSSTPPPSPTALAPVYTVLNTIPPALKPVLVFGAVYCVIMNYIRPLFYLGLSAMVTYVFYFPETLNSFPVLSDFANVCREFFNRY